MNETIDYIIFGANGFAIAVQWYERCPSDPARLSFEMVDRGVCVVNATELRHWLPFADVEQTAGPPLAVLRPTRGKPRETPAAWAARAEVIDTENELKRAYRVRLDVEQVVLDRCW